MHPEGTHLYPIDKSMHSEITDLYPMDKRMHPKCIIVNTNLDYKYLFSWYLYKKNRET